MLYHISFDRVNSGLFTPRIPKTRTEGEDSEQARISFSGSIAGCFAGMPDGILAIENALVFDKKGVIPAIVHLYSKDENHIPRKNLIRTKWLLKNNWVPDAKYSKEAWIVNQNVQCEHEVIRITSVGRVYNPHPYEGKELGISLGTIEFERSTEDYDRLNYYYFWSSKDFEKATRYAEETGIEILKTIPQEQFMKVKIPKGIDAARFWEKTTSMFWRSMEDGFRAETKKHFPDRRRVLAHLGLKKSAN